MIGVPLTVWAIGALLVLTAAGVGAYLYLNQREHGDGVTGGSDGDAVQFDEFRERAAEATGVALAALMSTRAQLAYLAAGAAVGAVGTVAAAFVFYGLWSGIAVAVGLVTGVSAPWIYVRVMFTPYLRQPLGAAFFILAQLTFGAGALVRRDDGGYEWARLREDSTGLYAVLDSGRRVSIAGSRDELPKVAWAPLAVVEEKTDANMAQYTVDETFRTTRPDPKADGEMVETPLALADGGEGWHLDSSKLERWARGSANSELPRSGRRKALEEEGGQQRISQLVTMIGAGVLLVVGFAMTAGVMLL